MELEKAKIFLKEGIVYSVGNERTGMAESCIEYAEAIDTVIAELHAMQNLLDEKREELEHLQKENEKYISGELMTRNQAKHFEEINKKYYIHKDKIKDCFDDIEDYFERVSVPYEDIEFIKEKRNDLLKEE